MGCFPVDFQEAKRPIKTKSGKHPIKVRKRPIKEGKRPIKAMVLVGGSVSCLMGCFQAPPPWRKTAPLKRPIKRSMSNMPQAKTEVALQFLECCAAEVAPQHSLFCCAGMSFWPKAALQQAKNKQCNIEKAALQESGAFLLLSCGFHAPTFRHPRLAPAEQMYAFWNSCVLCLRSWGTS